MGGSARLRPASGSAFLEAPRCALVERGALHPVRDADGDLWFDPAELDEVERSGLAETVRAGSYVNTWFDPAELERLDALACDAGLSRADLLRQLVRSAG
ncbi:MAG: ribbon-helix-helix domain-containing protein [Actinomycetota bacterium]|nr:ribbon-helix-helix domain-containing protein [Actinomycetota bacterium]